MRKHLELITEEPKNPHHIGNVELTDSRTPRVKKNVETVHDMRNIETDETWERKVVGMGYVDFDDQDHYESSCGEEVERKLAEIDEKHLEKAGIEVLSTN